MATKKNPASKTETEEQLLEQQAEEEKPETGKADDQLTAQAKEIEKLKAQLAEMKKANRTPMDDAAVVKKAAEESAKAGVDPWEVTVNIRAPRRPGREDPWYWISVNGRSVQIPADDRYYDIKLPWAEAMINSLQAEKRAADFQDGLEVYDPVTNPHR